MHAVSLTCSITHLRPPLVYLQFSIFHLDFTVADLPKNQEEANALMAKSIKEIPAIAFYTVMPQLISRITHVDVSINSILIIKPCFYSYNIIYYNFFLLQRETALVVQGILKRVLIKFPAQAMWALAWIRQSRDSERCQIGNNIFSDAERNLVKDHNQSLYKLLVASKSLFSYLQTLAKHEVKDNTKNVLNVIPWKGEISLTEFIPPIQAALSASLISGGSGPSREFFPRHVPRMRNHSPQIQLMSSKARPKKIKFYVVSSNSIGNQRSNGMQKAVNNNVDIGEIHFLVKQEAKGDLRKDARVQDLNNVINRIMSTSNDTKGTPGQRRRLHLRTFAVTCLSEETGLLEWVPHTDSLRNLVSKTYNPQASPFSSRRRGRAITNLSDPNLRNNFEKKCQTLFFKSGNLTKAAAMFDELCIKPYPPILYWWLVQNFPDPHTWYEARTRFTLSCAIWSAVGHVIGLGDRHSENILVDTTNAECVHVDFDWYVYLLCHLYMTRIILFSFIYLFFAFFK